MALDCNQIGQEAKELTLKLEQFTDNSLLINIKAGGVAVDCTGASLAIEIRRDAKDATPLKSFSVTWVSRTLGQARADLYCDLTCGPRASDLASQYFFDARLTDSAGNRRSIIKGPCIVNRSGVR
jgi:hypothetical protein